MAPLRVAEPSGDVGVFSADCGEERVLPGGRTIHAKRTLYYGLLPIYRGRLFEEMAARVVGFGRDVATQLYDEFVRIRAGAVAVGERALVLPSRPEAHLPALIGLMVRAGAAYLGDEMVYLDPVLHRVHSTSLPLSIDAEDMPLFPDIRRDPPRRRRPIEGLPAVTPRRPVTAEELGGRESGPVPVAWIVLPRFEEGAETRLEPAGGSGALFEVTESVLNLHAWEDRALMLMKDLLEEVAVSRLVVGSLPEAAELLSREAPRVMEGVRT